MAFPSESGDPQSLGATSHAESLATLASHGGRVFRSSNSRYVIHTHTIPLATTIDQNYLLDENEDSIFHGYQAGEKMGVYCPIKSCMFARSDGTRGRENVKKNCPCHEVNLESGTMQPLCFMVYVKSLNRNLVNRKSDTPENDKINPEEIMFCQNSTGTFDNSYPGHLRDKVLVTGWQHITEKNIITLMNSHYWFRRFDKQYKLKKQLEHAIGERGLRYTKHIVMQSMHTINSLILKKLMALGPEVEGYKDIAKHTAWSFSKLMNEYTDKPYYNPAGLMVEPETGFYQDVKAFAGFAKSHFHREKREDRIAILKWRSTTKAFGAFFGTELKRLSVYIEHMWSSTGQDYTLSPAWMFRMSTLSQTRGMGYLPEAIAECKRQTFRNNVNREVVDVPPEIMHLQAVATRQRLVEGGIPPMILSEERISSRSEEEREMFQDAFSRIEMPLKGSASTESFVKEGGKLEDARRLLRLAIDNNWQIPVRDLGTNEIRQYIAVPDDYDQIEDVSRFLFWISYQLIINHWARAGEWDVGETHTFLVEGKSYQPAVMDAKIVHISEPGKERNLTKSHASLAWFLTPGAKLSQACLAILKEHRAGLLESGHEWRHQNRVSPLSDESGFIYDSSTGKLHEEIVQIFKDWTESTDFICKMVGYTHCRVFFDHVGFPRAYGRLILKTIVEPQPVSEVLAQVIGPTETIEPKTWHGSIREGFMMGNPMTKTILHLVHESERALVTHFLTRRGLKFRSNYKYHSIYDHARIDRDESQTSAETYVAF